MYKEKYKNTKDLIYFLLGALVYSTAINVFLSPSGISPGGFTGIATIVNRIASVPTGITLFVINLPVLLLGFFKLGGRFVLKTTLATTILSLILDISMRFFPPFKTDKMLSAMFGGILMGIGLSLVLLRGATTGGVDIIAKLVNRKHRHITIGKIILISDGIVITLNAVVYKNAENALYSMVAIYMSARIMDVLLYGADKGKILYIITAAPNEICNEINRVISRGVTKIMVVGGYTSEEKIMLMCTVRVHEVATVYNIISKYDQNAFVVVSDAGEIIGEGFKRGVW